MKKQILLLVIFGALVSNIYCQQTIFAENEWEKLTKQKFLAEFFEGFFANLGIVVAETGERISVLHQGDHFTIEKGIDSSKVDYILTINTENIKNLTSHASDGVIDNYETYKILAVMFTPLTKSTLENPLMTQNLPRFFNNIENNIHVTLYNPDKTESVSHTLIYINKEWIVVAGLHGTPKRIFKLDTKQALLYQQQVSLAIKTNSRKGWKEFKKWYLNWRKQVSVNA